MTRPTGILIGIFYVLAVFASVVLLAVVQLRSGTGSAFDTWLLKFDANQAFETTTRKPVLDALAKTLDRLSFTNECMRLFDDSGAPNVNVSQETLDEVKQLKAQHEDFEKLEWSDATCIFRGLTMLKNDKSYYENKRDELLQDLEGVEEARKQNSADYLILIKENGDFLAFKEMRNKWYTRLFVTTPYDLLVLLLVMFMGALGGMVRLLRDYGDPKRVNPEAKDYFFIPLIGAVVAIGGYVLAKTGLLLLSSSREEPSLSPFMIGLVGIVSGLLAREVIDSIAGTGRSLIMPRDAAKAEKEPAAEPQGKPRGGAKG